MSRVRSQYEIERSALAHASAQHAALAARVERAKRNYRAQGLVASRDVPAVKSIVGMNSSQVRQEIDRLSAALHQSEQAASGELDGRCRSAYEDAFAAAKAQMSKGRPTAILGEQVIERTERRRERPATAPDRTLDDAITSAAETTDRIIGRLADRAPAASRDRVIDLASMVGEATSAAQIERIVMTLRGEVEKANQAATEAKARSDQVDRWHERLHHVQQPEARDLEERIRRLDPDSPWPGGLAEQIERELVDAEREDERRTALQATRAALATLGYGVSDDFSEEAFSQGSLVTIPSRTEHMVRVRERRGSLLMDVVRVVGEPAADSDLAAEQALCDSLEQLKAEASRNGVALVMTAEPASGDLDRVERQLPTSSRGSDVPRAADRGGAKRSRSRGGSAAKAKENRR
jgi:hypothetical protein